MERATFLFVESYRRAFAFSLAIHLFLVSAAEGSMFIGKILNADHPPILVMYTTVPFFAQTTPTLPAIGVKENRVSIEKKAPHGSLTVEHDGVITQHQESKTYRKTKALNHLVRSFKNFQTELDQRVQKVQTGLTNMGIQKKRLEAVQTLVPQIFDLDKIPPQARKDLIPTYLAQMRLKIANEWSRLIESKGFGSKIAAVRYRLAATGMISGLELVSTSGERWFDQACLLAVERASPFDPLPFQFAESVKGPYLTVALTFHFRSAKSEKFV